MKLPGACLLILSILHGCFNNPGAAGNDESTATPVINYAVSKFFSHDTSLYTEGFLSHNGQLYIGTGSPEDHPAAKSIIGIVDLATGTTKTKAETDKAKYFGEGIAILNNKIYQLTYTTQKGFIYDATTFKKIGQFTYSNKQGWGLTTNGKQLIMSDGTNKLTFLDSGSLKPVRILPVTENHLPVDSLNELEFIKGFIYANVWLTDFIVKIDPASGEILGRLDLSSLAFEAKNKYAGAETLNGIAYDAAADKIYVTGKLWPTIYEVVFAH